MGIILISSQETYTQKQADTNTHADIIKLKKAVFHNTDIARKDEISGKRLY